MKNLSLFLLTLGFSYTSSAQWFVQNSTTSNNLYDVEFLNESYGVAVGEAGTILKTTDGGDTWTNLAFTGPDDFNGVALTGVDTIYVSGLGVVGPAVYRSWDGGVTWQKVLLDDSPISICTSPDDNLFAAANYIYHSQDGGEIWAQPYTVGPTVNPFSIQAANDEVIHMGANVGGIITYSAIVARSANGGTTFWDFDVFYFPNANALTAFSFIDPDTGYLFTNQFDFFDPNDSSQLIRVYNFQLAPGTGNDSLWIFSYESLNLLFPDYVNDCKFFSNHTGYAVGPKGIVYRSTDGGINWADDFSGSNELFALDMVDESTGYAVGALGTILKRGKATQVESSELMVSDLQLYPNPANDLVTVSFSLTKDGNTKILLTDVTGKVLHEISDAYLTRGIYQAFFSVSTFSPGLYLISILSGDEMIRKKMNVVR